MKTQLVTLKEMKILADLFKHDPNLVKSGHVRLTTPIGISNVPPNGTYWFTDWRRTNEQHFISAVKGKKVVLLVGCMDKNFATRAWQWAQQPNKLVIPIFIAGGIAQVDAPDRLFALKTIVDYVVGATDKAKSLEFIGTGHKDNCAGLKFMNNLSCSVSQHLQCPSGGAAESKFVEDRMKESGKIIFSGKPYQLWLFGDRSKLTATKIK